MYLGLKKVTMVILYVRIINPKYHIRVMSNKRYLKSSKVKENALMECDYMRVIFQDSTNNGPHTSSIGIAVF